MGLKVLKTYENAIEAHSDKNLLESEGVPAVLFDENTVSINPLYNITVGGIKLMVSENLLEKAWNIVNRNVDSNISVTASSSLTCPSCGSDNVVLSSDNDDSPPGFLKLLRSILKPKSAIQFKCANCGHTY